jgi:diketogulonate reductase-like aldo/keto reductase
MDPLHQDSEVRQWCEENGVMYTSYSTLGTQHRGDKNPVLTHPVIVSIAKAHKVSPAVVVLSWALELGVGVIPRSSNPKHIKELATVLGEDEDDFGLSLPTLLNEEEVEKITAIGAGEGKEKRVSDEL